MNVVEARRQVRRRQRVSRTSDNDSFPLSGGLNLVDPPAIIRPGYVLAAENYEMGLEGGYERIGGFERFDGQAAPSAQSYHLIPFRHSQMTAAMQVPGATITCGGGQTFEVIEAVSLHGPGTTYSRNSGARDFSSGVSRVTRAVDEDVIKPQRAAEIPLLGSEVAPNIDHNGLLVPAHVHRITETTETGRHNIGIPLTQTTGSGVAVGESVTASIFLKYGTRRYVMLTLADSSGAVVSFTNWTGGAIEVVVDLQERAIVSASANVTAEVEGFEYGNGWFRVSIKTGALTTAAIATLWMPVSIMESADADGSGVAPSYTGDTTNYFYLGGFQCDKGTGAAPSLTPFRNSNYDSIDGEPSGVGYFLARELSATLASAGATQDALTDGDGNVIGEYSGGEQERGARTISEHLATLKYVANLQRDLIGAVPGGGPIRGVWFYNGTVYAFRDDAASSATETRCYKSTSSGWVQVTLAPYLDFDAGLPAGEAAVIEGATITGGTSGATAVIERVNLINDDWAGSNAAGRLILSGITGGPFQNNEALNISATPVASADGANVAPTLAPGGTYRFRTYNFYGASDLKRMYGVSGVDNFFEYDDDDGIFALYRTGMTLDTPTHIGVHLYHLFLGFPGGSVQNSGTGRPAVWTVITGANELGVGDDIIDFMEEVLDTLFIFTRNQSYQLSGRTTATFALNRFDPQNGAIEHSVQRIGQGMHLDDRGFASLATSDRYGNYRSNTFSRLVHKLLNRVKQAATVTASVIYRTGSRYRCFFSDGRFFSIGVVGTNVSGIMLCDYGIPIRCACSEEDTDGQERIFYGSDDGYIYESEKGTSFDGKPIRAGLRLPWHHSGRPDRVKHYREGRIEAILDGQATLYCLASLGSGAIHRPELDISAEVGGAVWDQTMEWEGFYWDGLVEPLKNFRIDADGTNISLQLRHESDVERPHTLRAVVYQTSMRGIKRGASVG